MRYRYFLADILAAAPFLRVSCGKIGYQGFELSAVRSVPLEEPQ